MNKKTGLFFGSFNPIHIGHLAIANFAVTHGGLDEIWFIVTPKNPFKSKASLLPDYHRLEMVHRAIGNDIRFKASDIEFTLSSPHYTANTLSILKEKYSAKDFALILGSDNLTHFNKWYKYEYILDHFTLWVYPRHESSGGELNAHPSVQWFNAPKIEVSATFIRDSLKSGKDVRHFLPSSVWNYIDETGLLLGRKKSIGF
jgi:nicotinate-nucleotide adenylyltransferase